MARPVHPNALKAPPAALADAGAQEIIRAWIVKGGLQVSLMRSFDDPSVWGLLLVDIARHASRIYATEGDCSEAEALDQIRKLWNAEIGSPTDMGTTEQSH